jgi:hypothetical protein
MHLFTVLCFIPLPKRANAFLDSTQELDAMRHVAANLDPLPEDARARIISWAVAKYGVRVFGISGASASARSADPISQSPGSPKTALDDYASLAEFFDATNPSIDAEKALVVGLWMQKKTGTETFDSAAVNRELKHLGHGVGNITAAFSDLITQRPALAMQTAKSGSSQQARKKYKITRAGEKAVAEMLATSNEDA